MASVTGITAEQAARIKASSVIDAYLTPTGNLILVTDGGTETNVGPIADNYSTAELRESIRVIKSFDTVPEDITIPDWFTTGVSNPAISLGTALPGASYDASWSPDMKYVAYAHTVSPYISIYQITKAGAGGTDVFSKITNPSTLPPAAATCLSFSPDGLYLSVGDQAPPYLITYKRAANVFTALSGPAVAPVGVLDVAWSPNGEYLAIGTNQPGGFYVYKRAGDVLTKLTTPTMGGTVSGYKVSWSNGGQYLVVAAFNDKFFIYKRDGDTFTKLSDPIFPTGAVSSTGFSPNDLYLFATVEQSGTTGLHIYKRDGDIFVKLSSPSGSPALANGACWSPDGKYLVVTTAASTVPALTVFQRNLDVFTAVTPLPASWKVQGKRPSFSPDGRFLTSATWESTPFANLNKSSLKQVNEYQTPTVLVP